MGDPATGGGRAAGAGARGGGGWDPGNRGPPGWPPCAPREARKQETPEIPPDCEAFVTEPWQEPQRLPSGRANVGWAEIHPGAWFPCSSTQERPDVVLLVEQPPAPGGG